MAGAGQPEFEALLSMATEARRAGELHRAARLLEQAIEEATKSGDLYGTVAAYRGLGHVETDRGSHDAADAAFQEAVRTARAAGDACLLAHALRHAGRAAARMGRVAEALAACDEALGIYRARPDATSLDVANAWRARARILEDAGREVEAVADWHAALPLYEQAGVEEGARECRQRLA